MAARMASRRAVVLSLAVLAALSLHNSIRAHNFDALALALVPPPPPPPPLAALPADLSPPPRPSAAQGAAGGARSAPPHANRPPSSRRAAAPPRRHAAAPHGRRGNASAAPAPPPPPPAAAAREAAARMDLEDGVRLGSLCDGARRPCAVADDVYAALAAEPAAPAAEEVCLYSSLTEAYVEGHVVFMRSALRRTPSLSARPPPLYVLEQGLSAASRGRVAAAYARTRFVSPPRGGKDVRVVTKFALNKEKTALFGLRGACGRVLKLDTGDMLALADLAPLLALRPGRSVWAAQALGQPHGRINGGLMLFGGFWLHPLTQAALDARAERESREQTLFGEFFGAHLALLPKRYNVEQRFWDAAPDLAAWREAERKARASLRRLSASALLLVAAPCLPSPPLYFSALSSPLSPHCLALYPAASSPPIGTHTQAHGEEAVPSLERVALLHFVGRDKPWQRLDRGGVDTAADLCRRLRSRDEETCEVYLAVQALWWREFGRGACILVGDGARGKGQGFVVEQFAHILRVHTPLEPRDVGNLSLGQPCPNVAECVAIARSRGCEQYTLGVSGHARHLVDARSLLHVYQRKLGVFGGPPT
ncbi:hypothetical protein AB1Y20_002887 [Prymnesium parvum]|uniref:Hexosyltransferase n=1 Tax=Prymnesium parvum TaxID=97485 RepID=A0AB34JA75_PRYPA